MEETAFSSSLQKTSDILENFVNLCFIERDKEEGETTAQHVKDYQLQMVCREENTCLLM